MIEVAVVLGVGRQPLHWHVPPEASRVALPDSRSLWEVLWAERERVSGVAHTHPGHGEPWPSFEDLTTFDACELGLGVRLEWWIATADRVRRFARMGHGPFDYAPVPTPAEEADTAPWLAELRRRSGM